MKPKILYVIDNLEFGGGEQGFAQLAGALRDRYEILFACQPGGLLAERLKQIGIRIRPLDFRRQVSPSRIIRLMAMIKEEGIHLVHTTGARADFYTRIAARLAGAPVVVSTITMLVEGYEVSSLKRTLYRAAIRLSERYCDGFIAVSNAVRRVLVEDHRIPTANVVMIHNSGIELDTFKPDGRDGLELRRELDLHPEGPIVGTIGRLVYQKAYDVFLRAASLVLRAVPDAQFVIVGEGPLRPTLERMKDDLGLHTCRFAGFRSDIPNMLSLMDVFALASILEGSPVVILEALGAVRPIVATRINGVTDVVQHGVTGLLVPPGDPAALADAIVSLLKDRELSCRLAEAGQKLVEERFALRRMVEEVDRFYTTLLQKKGTC
ncbi:MAG: glycosyltransferase [Candidatus Methylomirabilales bacterium]